MMATKARATRREWTIFSAHGLVLFCLAGTRDITIREASAALGLTERHVTRIIQELEGAGMLIVTRGAHGRRNTYAVNPHASLRHPTLAHIPLGRIIEAVTTVPADSSRDTGERPEIPAHPQ
jgi:hypothetical protein